MGHIKYKTKNISNEFRFLDSYPDIKWNKFKNEKFSTSRGLNIFVITDGDTWKASIEKFPNHRGKDVVGRRIFSVIEAEGLNGDEESKMIFKLISFILLNDNDLEKCGKSLNEYFDDSFISEAFETDKTAEIKERIKQFINELADTNYLETTGFKAQYTNIVDFSSENAHKILKEISLITDKGSSDNGYKIFAINDLPYEKSDLQYIASEIDNIEKIVILTKADSRLSLRIDDIKKKVSTLPVKITEESPTKSKSGLKVLPIIVISLLIISLIANMMLLIDHISKNSQKNLLVQEFEASKKNLVDSLNNIVYLKDNQITALTQKSDSLSTMLQNFSDTIKCSFITLSVQDYKKIKQGQYILKSDNNDTNIIMLRRCSVAKKKGELFVCMKDRTKVYVEFDLK